MQWRGRKFAFITACIIIIISWILAFIASNVTTLLICESFQGLGTNSLLAASLLSLSEMVAPKYRSISLQMFGTAQSLGMALVGIMVPYVHWKTISIIMSVPIVIALLAACMWPESPSWLAFKGEFDRCEKAFVLLRGDDEVSKRELKALINAQRENCTRNQFDSPMANFKAQIKRRDFYMPCLHMFLLINMMYWSGSAVVLIYAIDLLRKSTQNENVAYFGGVAISSILFVGVATTGVLIKFFNNKTVLIWSTFTASVGLLSVVIVTYLQSVHVLASDSTLSLYSLIAFMVPNCLGLNSLVFDIAAELMPVKHKGIGGALYIVYNCILLTSSLKLSPYLFLYLDIWGTFLIYTLNSVICGLLVWRYIPETKGRTLQEIEDYYMYGSFVKRHEVRETLDAKQCFECDSL